MRHFQILLYADIILKSKHTKVSLIARKEAEMDVNDEKTNYVFIFPEQKEKSNNIKTVNNSFENAAKFKYFETTVTNEQFVNEESNSS
jgi:hypothetical protein